MPVAYWGNYDNPTAALRGLVRKSVVQNAASFARRDCQCVVSCSVATKTCGCVSRTHRGAVVFVLRLKVFLLCFHLFTAEMEEAKNINYYYFFFLLINTY